MNARLLCLVLLVANMANANILDGKEIDKTHVFCSDGGDQNWQWLPSDFQLKGRWALIDSGSGPYGAFVVTRDAYNKARAECENYFPLLDYPQPAINSSSAWMRFVIEEKNGRTSPQVGFAETLSVVVFH